MRTHPTRPGARLRVAVSTAAALLATGCSTTVVGTASPAPVADVTPAPEDLRLSAADLVALDPVELCADLPTASFDDIGAGVGTPTFGYWDEGDSLSCDMSTSFGDVSVTVELTDRRYTTAPFPRRDEAWVAVDGVADQAWVLLDPSTTAPEGGGPVQVSALSGDVAVHVWFYSPAEGPYPDLDVGETAMRQLVTGVVTILGTPGTPMGGPVPVTSTAAELTPPAPDDGPAWSLDELMPLLAGYADDESETWASFGSDYAVTVPCGGEGTYGAAPGLLERTAGGAMYGASAEILGDAVDAFSEYSRLRNLAVNCTTPYDYVSSSTGSILLQDCRPLVVARADGVTRYAEQCGEAASDTVIFRSGNAVISLNGPAGTFDTGLDDLLDRFEADN